MRGIRGRMLGAGVLTSGLACAVILAGGSSAVAADFTACGDVEANIQDLQVLNVGCSTGKRVAKAYAYGGNSKFKCRVTGGGALLTIRCKNDDKIVKFKGAFIG